MGTTSRVPAQLRALRDSVERGESASTDVLLALVDLVVEGGDAQGATVAAVATLTQTVHTLTQTVADVADTVTTLATTVRDLTPPTEGNPSDA